LRDQLAEQARTEEDFKKIRRAKIAGWIFAMIGVILVGFGYMLYDIGLSYSGIFLMIMGIVSIAFGSVLVRYSRKIV
jgi:drug/metabolite transporter (DMT)-like permease